MLMLWYTLKAVTFFENELTHSENLSLHEAMFTRETVWRKEEGGGGQREMEQDEGIEKVHRDGEGGRQLADTHKK